MSFLLNQCFFCAEDSNLIQMDTNSLIIEGVYIDFAQLILELMQVKIDDDCHTNLICTGCKDQLTQFYIMKKQAAKRRKASDVRKMRIVDTVISFLDTTTADFIVRKYSKFLALHPDTANSEFLEQLMNCSYLLELPPETEQSESVEMFEVTEFNDNENMDEFVEEPDQFEAEICRFEDVQQEEEINTNTIEVGTRSEDDYIEEITEIEKPQKAKIKRFRKSNIGGKQKEWIKMKTKHSIVQIETAFGNRTQWCCERCTQKCFNTEATFRLHLKQHLEELTIEDIIEELKEFDGTSKIYVNPEEQSLIEERLWVRDQMQTQMQMLPTNKGPQATWTCSQCDYVSQSRDRFRVHLQKTHTNIVVRGPSKHSCIDCRLRFDGENHLNVHKNCHRIFDVIAPYAVYPECKECKMLFVNNEDLQNHVERHKENPELLNVPIMSIGVTNHGEAFLDERLDDKPEVTGDNAITCGHCMTKFASDVECKHHMMLFHAVSFVCPFDQRVFDGIPTLSFGNHLRQFHPEIFPELEIACSLCKMQFETVYDKLAHMKVCKSKKFHCDHCDKSFFRKSELINHLKVVTGLSVFACHLCGKRCKDQGDLNIHLRCHTNDRPYPCPHCGKAYKTSSARASHVESHMEQIHGCSICNVKFRRRILYQRHMKLLHDEAYRQKSFAENTCKICGKSYLRKTHFKNHMKTHDIQVK